MEERYIASIDLGTSKFGLCVARVKGNDVQIVYYKETPSDGIRNSLVMNPLKASTQVKKAIEEAEAELMIKIHQVVVGLPRYNVSQEIATGKVDRQNAEEFITAEEVGDLKALALETYPLQDSASRIMYGAVAQSFSIDDQIEAREDDVVGAISSDIKGTFKVFIGNRKATVAVDKIFNTLGIAIAKKYFLPDVVANAVLTEDEKQSGVALVDIGAGVTSVSIYLGGIMRSYAAIPFGGWNITNDIRSECSISEALAENIKRRFGSCLPAKLGTLSEKVLQLRVTDPIKEVSVKYISEVIDSRCREILSAVLYYILESGLKDELRSGIVLTGGGAKMSNIGNLLKDMSGYDIRPGYPKHKFSAEVSNIYELGTTASVGMILAAKDDNLPDCATRPEVPAEPEKKEAPIVEEVIETTELFPDVPKEEKEKKKKAPKTKTIKVTPAGNKEDGKKSKPIIWEIFNNLYEKMTEE